MFHYLKISEARKGSALVVGSYDTQVPDYVNLYGEDVVEYDDSAIGYLPHYISYDEETKSIREATVQERFDRNQYSINPYEEYVKDGVVKRYPMVPEGLVKHVFNLETEQFEESATPQEIQLHELSGNLGIVQGEINDTNKFDLVNYRTFVQSNGDNIEEMDTYRLSLLSTQKEIINQISQVGSGAKTRSKRSLSLIAKPERPLWSKKPEYK